MSEAIPQTEFMYELTRRADLEQLIGYEVCKSIGFDQASYIASTDVQGELF